MNVLPVQVRKVSSRTSRSMLAGAASAALFALSLTFPSVASAGSDLVICHATGSNSNPYITNTPDKTADAGGHAGHTGPVWSPTLPKGTTWGDIIPPFDIDGGGHFNGLNWSVDGQEIWNNGCNKVHPDLKLTKSGSGGATVGTTGSYTISVSNIGNGTAHAPFTVSDTMPTGVVATAASGAAWTCTVGAAGASISCTRSSDLAPGVSAAVITVSVNWVTIGSKKNTASVTVLPDDPPANNTGSTTSTVAAAPPNAISVNVAKTSDANADGTYSDGETAPAGGGSITYRVVISNPTNFDLTVDAIGDVVDIAASTAVACDANVPAGSPAGQVSLGSSLPASLPANSTRYCYFHLAGPADGDSSTDTVTVDVHETAHADNTTSNDDDTTVHRAAPPPVLSGTVVKTSDADGDTQWTDNEVTTVTAGSSVAYRAVIHNTSSVTVGLSLSDTYGPGPSGTGTTITPTCVPAAPSTLAADASFTCNFSVAGSSPAAGASTVDTFTATLSATGSSNATPHDSATVSKAEASPSATVTKTNNANGDNEFSTAEEATAEGQQVRFKLHITNTSPYAINVGQSVSDKVWVGETEPTEFSPSTYQCEEPITNLAPNASADCYFNAPSYAAPDGQVKSDRATVTLTKYVAPVQVESLRRFRAAVVAAPPAFTATSNASTVTTRLPRATAVAPTVIPSRCSNGVATLPSFTVPVTPGVVYSPAVGAVGAPNTTTTVTATAAAGFVLTNPGASPFTVSFGPAATGCAPPPPVVVPTPSPNPAPDDNLGISKTGPGSAQPGDELVYSLDVKNVKGTPATAFTVTDVLPDGLSYSNAEGTGFTCANAGQVITCVYGGTLAVGQTSTITVRALLDSSYKGKTVVNTAIVDPGRADTDAADNTATATTDVTPLPVTGGGGGAAEQPSASPTPAPPAADGGGGALPFTGTDSGQLLKLGVLLLLSGLVAALVARRRRTQVE